MKKSPVRGRDGLSVTRKQGEAIVFRLASGERIIVRLHKIGPSRVTVHCVAPESVSILREELLQGKESNNG